MRTYLFIALLAILGNHLYIKVTCSTDPDLYLDEEEGSGDPEALPSEHIHNKDHLPPDDEGDEGDAGSGMKPPLSDHKGGGKESPPDEDAEDDYYDYYEEEEVEGSGFYPTYDESPLSVDEEKDIDFGIVPELPKKVFEEVSVYVGPSLEESPDRMPSNTPPPTLTDNHHDMENNNIRILTQKDDERQVSIFAQPGILAAFIGGAVMGLLCAILLVMFIVYRMRKRDEGSYPLDEPKRVPLTFLLTK
ncbi:UNVERIFIED_CONTAM: hypothetical protein RMT77_008082 [Armadillidium vulgare]